MASARVTLYTDGACSCNPGPGGWACVLQWKESERELSGFEPQTTNNRMELMAVIQGLSALKRSCEVDVFTDSSYVCNAFKLGWIHGWRKNNWKRKENNSLKELLNADLWQELFRLSTMHSIEWHQVKGHSTNELNNRCDELARNEIKANVKL